jgi:hypothetical protein
MEGKRETGDPSKQGLNSERVDRKVTVLKKKDTDHEKKNEKNCLQEEWTWNLTLEHLSSAVPVLQFSFQFFFLFLF